MKRFRNEKLTVALTAVLLSVLAASTASATTSISQGFDNAGELSTNFSQYIQSGSVTQSSSGGIDNTGALSSPGSADAVFTSKSGYSLGPVDSSYTFTSYIQSVGNSGYSGMGFTSSAVPNSSNTSTLNGGVFRPNDALGISVHGGGFVFHNGTSFFNGSWNRDNSGITTVTKTSNSELLNTGSASDWYKIVLKITRKTTTTFDMRVEVWPSDSHGVLLNASAADAIFELRNQTNTALTSAASINTYINFSGDRVRYFDGYAVDLAGGSTVVAAGAPVVLTANASESNNVVTVQGNVTGDGGAQVTERGFVYGTSAEPTVSDSKVVLGSGIGTFSGGTVQLPNGTHFFRAYATNANGTSYGVDIQMSLVNAPQAQTVSWAPTNTEVLANALTLTPDALASSTGAGAISYSIHSAGATGCTVNASTGELSFTAAGNCVVRATAAAATGFLSASKDVTFTIGSTTTSLALNLDIAVGDQVENAPVNYETTGLKPGEPWNLVVRSTPQTIAGGNIGASGALLGSALIPAGLEPGWHTITLSGTRLNGGIVSTTIWFEVSATGELIKAQTSEPQSSEGGLATLSNTGSTIGTSWFAASGVLCVAGIALATLRRRKKG